MGVSTSPLSTHTRTALPDLGGKACLVSSRTCEKSHSLNAASGYSAELNSIESPALLKPLTGVPCDLMTSWLNDEGSAVMSVTIKEPSSAPKTSTLHVSARRHVIFDAVFICTSRSLVSLADLKSCSSAKN